ncbi:uncharacterized protein NPIL_493641 [Nephila pilipes]|uniref:Sodium channel protein n=2 Tax=Nephila pilipes TaxID=299642 RepID=A0A8X6TJU1_NEPPI|nr:uncharacterized protein NPIL_493641 [Nephila pilipes]
MIVKEDEVFFNGVCDSVRNIATKMNKRRKMITPGILPTKRIRLTIRNINKKEILKISLTWKLLKIIIFIVCIVCFAWQSAEFFQIYFTYPTTTNIDITFPDVLNRPAFTLCNNNPVKREKFCAEYPHLCQKPNNLTEFCIKHPHFCKNNVSNLVIPKLGYYANDSEDEVRRALLQIYLHNISQDGADIWSWEFPFGFEDEEG